MKKKEKWNSIYVFVSSTFRDMHAERDYLRDIVFPELTERLKERRCYIQPIDLRWGVETLSSKEQQEKELLVLKTCLNEIERCRPFLIALLGDRYGWVPPENQMKAVIEEKGYKTDYCRKSITALEVEYGVLNQNDNHVRSLFYFRKPLPYIKMPTDVAAVYSDEYNPDSTESIKRLYDLKEKIRQKVGDNRIKYYEVSWDAERQKVTGLEQWGIQVIEDIMNEVCAEYQNNEDSSSEFWQEEEARILEEYIDSMSYSFQGREEILKELYNFCLSGQETKRSIIVLKGISGAGKSSVLAKLACELQKEDCLVFAHAAGISPLSSSINAMLDRWIWEISNHLQLSSLELKDVSSLSEKKKVFFDLLHQIDSNMKVVCLIDALNQFEGSDAVKKMTWLPASIPANVKILATTLLEEATNVLENREDTYIMNLPVLSGSDAERIIHSVCKRYSKVLHPDIVASLISKKQMNGEPCINSPLWLRVALEELLLLDEDDFSKVGQFLGTPEQQLHAMILEVVNSFASTVEGLYKNISLRAEKLFGREWVESILELLATSRYGLRAEDLRAIVPEVTNVAWDSLKFALLKRYLRAHIIQKNTSKNWDFVHSHFRNSIQEKLKANTEKHIVYHKLLCRHLESLSSDDPLKLSEIIYHYYKADEKYNTILYFDNIERTFNEIDGVNRILISIIFEEEKHSENATLKWIFDLLRIENLDFNVRYRFLRNLIVSVADIIRKNAKKETLYEFCNRAEKELTAMVKESSRSAQMMELYGAYCRLAGEFYDDFGDDINTIKYYTEFYSIMKELHAANPDDVEIIIGVSESSYDMASMCLKNGNVSKAGEYLNHSIDICETAYAKNPDNLRLADAYYSVFHKAGDFYERIGDHNYSLQFFIKALKIIESLMEKHGENYYILNYSILCGYIGEILLNIHNIEKAIRFLQSSMDICENFYNTYPDDIDWADSFSLNCSRLGRAYISQGNFEKGEELLVKSYNISKGICKKLPGRLEKLCELANRCINLGDFNIQHMELQKAKEFYTEAYTLYDKLCAEGGNDLDYLKNYSICCSELGDIHFNVGELESAAYYLLNAHQTAQKLYEIDHNRIDFIQLLAIAYKKIGMFRANTGGMDYAHKAYINAFQLYENLCKADEDNEEFLLDLSDMCRNVGDLMLKAGDYQGAEKYYTLYFEKSSKLCTIHLNHEPYLKSLYLSNSRLGEVFLRKGDLKRALGYFQSGHSILHEINSKENQQGRYARDYSVSFSRIADIYLEMKNYSKASECYMNSFKIMKRLYSKALEGQIFARDYSNVCERLGGLYMKMGNMSEAEKFYVEGNNICRNVYECNPNRQESINEYAQSCSLIGYYYYTIGNKKKAIDFYEQSFMHIKRLNMLYPDNVEYVENLKDISESLQHLGGVL